jgi:hypothetical protein
VPSLGDLVDEVISTLSGYSTVVPAMGVLVGPITAGSLELALDFGDNPGASRPNGIVELGNELILVHTFDANTGVAAVPPWGRGFQGSTAAAHDAGTAVTVRPRYPRKHVAQVINQVIAGSCPPLYAPRDLDPIDTGAFVGLGYPLPAGTIRVLRVDATDPYPPEIADRRVLRKWRVRSVAGTQLLEIDRCEVFQTVQVTVAATPGRLVNDSDDFAAVTGLSESAADLVVFGAVARLILGADLARQQVSSVEAASRGGQIQSGSASTVSRYFQALYTQRLQAEQDRLNQTHPIQLLRRG